jgi:hypothetical protein
MSGFFGIVRQDGKPIEERFLQTITEQLGFPGRDGNYLWRRNNVAG